MKKLLIPLVIILMAAQCDTTVTVDDKVLTAKVDSILQERIPEWKDSVHYVRVETHETVTLTTYRDSTIRLTLTTYKDSVTHRTVYSYVDSVTRQTITVYEPITTASRIVIVPLGSTQVQIQAAVNQAAAQASGVAAGSVYIPTGSYNITAPIVLPRGVEIKGSDGTQLNVPSGYSGAVFDMTGNVCHDRMLISGIRMFELSPQLHRWDGIRIAKNGYDNCTVFNTFRDLEVWGANRAIYVELTGSAWMNDNVMEDIRSMRCNWLLYVSADRVLNNWFDGNTFWHLVQQCGSNTLGGVYLSSGVNNKFYGYGVADLPSGAVLFNFGPYANFNQIDLVMGDNAGVVSRYVNQGIGNKFMYRGVQVF